MRIIWRMSFFQFLAKRLCAFVILAVIALPACNTNSNLARDSDDASPLLAQAETSSGSLEWEILYEEAEKLWEQGDYRRGISVARKALEVAETSFGKDDKTPENRLICWDCFTKCKAITPPPNLS